MKAGATASRGVEKRKGRVLLAHAYLTAGLETLKGEVLNEERLSAGSSASFAQLSKLRAIARSFMEQLDTLMERRALRFEAEKEALQVECDNLAEMAEDFQCQEDLLNEECKHLKKEHARSLEQHEQAMAKATEQITRLDQEKHDLSVDRKSLIAEQSSLQQQLEEAREKLLCCVCFDKPRDTLVMPCLHFQYCFSCLMRHRDKNGNTCPTCRGDIQGLCMCSFLK